MNKYKAISWKLEILLERNTTHNSLYKWQMEFLKFLYRGCSPHKIYRQRARQQTGKHLHVQTKNEGKLKLQFSTLNMCNDSIQLKHEYSCKPIKENERSRGKR